MEEIKNENSDPVSEGPTESRNPKSREPLLGGILLAAIILFLVLAALGVGWAIWGGVKETQEARSELSITTLGEMADEAGEAISQVAPVPLENTNTNTSTTDTTTQKTTAISVLNGGAAGGSAGRLAEAIKQEGYTQVTAGDTTGDYTGVVIYHAEAAANEAASLKEVVAKTYPNVTVAQAIASNAETSRSPLTIIIGK